MSTNHLGSTMTKSLPATPVARPRAPLHSDISQCATNLWTEYGRPEGRDIEIWLEAERRLSAATTRQEEGTVKPPPDGLDSGGRVPRPLERGRTIREASPPPPQSKPGPA